MMRRLLPVFCCLMAWPFALPAAEFSRVGNTRLPGFETIYSHTDSGLQCTIIGHSLLTGKTREEKNTAPLAIAGPVRKALLIWSGETGRQTAQIAEIDLLTPGHRRLPIRAERLWHAQATGTLYAAVADVTAHVVHSGVYGVAHLRSDPVHHGGKDPYAVAGWALVVITADAQDAVRHGAGRTMILVQLGLQIVKPGALHEIPVLEGISPDRWTLQRIGIIGGHGRAGNGSGNLLNGRALSGGEDWNGSAGPFWDIDTFAVTDYDAHQGTILTIDPLLQWLYPVGIVLRLDERPGGIPSTQQGVQ